MLSTEIERYITVRQRFGRPLKDASRQLRAFARFAEQRGDSHVRAERAIDWATAASTPRARGIRLQTVRQLARFLRAEDTAHEVPSSKDFPTTGPRLSPYIYEPGEIRKLMSAARPLYQTYPLRRVTYATLLGLLSCTGLRISEALNLTLRDVEPGGVLLIRNGKGGKSRLVPLHQTALNAIDRYILRRRKVPTRDPIYFSQEITEGSRCLWLITRFEGS